MLTTAAQIIYQVLAAQHYQQVFTHSTVAEHWYKHYLKQIHPDRCPHPQAALATQQLNHWWAAYQQSLSYPDDAGMVSYTPHSCTVRGSYTLLNQSYCHYSSLLSLNDAASRHFRQYLPTGAQLQHTHLRFSTSPTQRIVPLAGLTLPPKHVAWVMSRMLEFITWLHQSAYSHNGIAPESLYIAPQSHGLICTSFYHLCRLGGRLTTLSAARKHWYDDAVFRHKTALQSIDVAMAQRTAICLLGDPSGVGVRLKTSCPDLHPQYLQWLQTPQHNSYQAFVAHRQLLGDLFGKPTFHVLDL